MQQARASAVAEAAASASASEPGSWWHEFVPIRQVSDEQVETIHRERERMENIRLRMEMQKFSDRQAGGLSGREPPATMPEDR